MKLNNGKKMENQKTKIVLELEDCRKCPYHINTPYPTKDSFERPEYFWCKHPDHEQFALDPENERRRVEIKERRDYKSLSFVAGYVEWRDKTPIPEWCPIRLEK